jgi:hypothetical protein
MAADWVTISALATAGGTLVLALATFASVRSANRAARVAEQALFVGLRPLLMPSRLDDPVQKVGFADAHWLRPPGGGGSAEATDGAVYLAMSLRNVGSGVAVLHGWSFHAEAMMGVADHSDVADFRRLTRDIYVAPGDLGFWQGAFRDPATPEFAAAAEAVTARRPLTIEVLYSDFEGGQRMIGRFSLQPAADDRWLVAVTRHWNLDHPDPRQLAPGRPARPR